MYYVIAYRKSSQILYDVIPTTGGDLIELKGC